MSRLDRLLSLLETGSSAVTRKAAALQLGEVQRLHPHELHNLLASVSKYLHHPAWDTRIAAGQAVEAILSNVPAWQPIGTLPDDLDGEMKVEIDDDKKLCFKTFDFETVSTKSAHLMGSEGKEYDADVTKKEDSVSMEKQRETLNAKLGLDICSKLGIITDNLYTSEDFKISVTEQNHSDKMNVSEVVGLSMREMNRARRKAKQALLRQRSTTGSSGQDSEADLTQPDKKKIKLENQSSSNTFDYFPPDSLPTPDNTGYWPPEALVWPVDWFCEKLLSDLFSPGWVVRHGAATALRHLIKTHGSDGGRTTNTLQSNMSTAHQEWLEDVALRLVCVLTLDRFGDFISDQVVAPVRETCAQALGSVSLHMSEKNIVQLVKVLLKLLEHADWETRHGGLLGIKYTFAVRQDLLESLLSLCLDGLHIALKDKVDDVGAVAGAALSLAVGPLTELYPDRATSVFHTLATHIPELDDLTPAASTFVPLVVQLLSHNQISSQLSISDEVERLVRRVWSLLEHNNSSVRKAALETLSALPSYHNVELLQSTLRHIFQCALFEHCPSVIVVIEKVWYDVINKSDLSELLLAACPFMTHWLCLAMQPSRIPFDSTLLLKAKHLCKDGKNRVGGGIDSQDVGAEIKVTELKMYIGGNETVPIDQREANALSARYLTSQMLGFLSQLIVKPAPGALYRNESESPVAIYVNVLLVYLNSKSSLQRFIAGLVIGQWASVSPPSPPPSLLVNKLNECLNETIYYDEIAVAFTKLLQDTKDFLALMKHYEVPNIDSVLAQNVFTFDQMEYVCGDEVALIINSAKLKPKLLKNLEERRLTLISTISVCHSEYTALNIMTLSSMAGGLLHLGELPEKPGPLVKPLMDCIKREDNQQLRELGANNVAKLVNVCLERNPSTVSKVLTNLCNYLRCDTEFAPQVDASSAPTNNAKNAGAKNNRNGEKIKNCDDDTYNGIHTLTKQQQNAERALLRRCNSSSGRAPGRPPLIAPETPPQLPTTESTQKQKLNQIQRLGATITLVAIVKRFGPDLSKKLPQLWKSIVGQLMETVVPKTYKPAKLSDLTTSNDLIGILLVMEVTVSAVHPNLFPKLLDSFDCLVCLLYHELSAVRHMAARCIASLSAQDCHIVMPLVIRKVLPLLGVSENITKRQGAMETIYTLMEKMQLTLVPYIAFLIIPVMGRMSDQEHSVRTLATLTFARLIQLMPLDGGKDNAGLSKDLVELKSTQRTFLEQLFNPTQIEDYKVPVPISAQLRSYQQSGVNWLSFLNKYKLHGILCDDMGLGKTIQSICILAGDHYDRSQRFKETGDSDCAPLPSLVVCPPTLTGHWVFEVDKFISKRYLNPLEYAGTPNDRAILRNKVKKHNLVVASYDIVRNDIEFFSSIKWNYCILDEGHVIKNVKTKSTQAIKMLKANHRLILSGTPIQNNVLELWSLFDFLMPGFLGTEKQFTCRYSRPILASRDPKSTPKEQQAGVLAMEALHRQVLPFVLRRIKEDVLKDLPPKITQDYYCELSPLQQQLYEDFTKSQAHQSLADNINSKHHNQAHIFQALRYMQNVCNHPKLALTPKHPQFAVIKSQLDAQKSKLSDIHHAAKLPALKQLLNDCGIGVENGAGQEGDLVVNQHRALIFCQLKAMLDILEHDFFRIHMPSVSYLRLDSSIPASCRNSVVTTFNNDPSIDILLLTTQVGGLGLNLTGADTVIFIEHDWSPMRDLQAMDRAHRIGQKKVVNVYRLITKSTLEEKIMGLQKFKLMTANTVISPENASLETMGTDKLLDLFSTKGEEDKTGDKTKSGSSGSGSPSSRTFIESLPSLWDHKDYDTEYDINNFINSLRPAHH